MLQSWEGCEDGTSTDSVVQYACVWQPLSLVLPDGDFDSCGPAALFWLLGRPKSLLVILFAAAALPPTIPSMYVGSGRHNVVLTATFKEVIAWLQMVSGAWVADYNG